MLVAAGQHDSGQGRERARLVGQHQPGDQVGPVAGRDHRDVGPQPGQHVRQAHRGHDQPERLPVQPVLAAQHELGRRPASTSARKVGADSSGLSGIAAVTTSGSSASAGADRLEQRRDSTRLAITATGVGVVGAQLGDARSSAAARICSGRPARGRAPPAPPVSRGWPRSWR